MHGLIQFNLGLAYFLSDYQITNLPIIAKNYLTSVMIFNELGIHE